MAGTENLNTLYTRLLHNARQSTKTDRETTRDGGVKGNLGNGLIMRVAKNIAVKLRELWRRRSCFVWSLFDSLNFFGSCKEDS